MTITSSYSYATVDLFPDLNDPSLVGAWMCDPASGKMIDLTVSGNDGAATAVPITENHILSTFKHYWGTGTAYTALGGASAFPLTDVTMCIWFRQDDVAVQGYVFDYFENANDNWGILAALTGAISIYDDIDAAAANRYGTPVIRGTTHFVVAQLDNLENKLYIDGVLVGSGSYALDSWSSFSGVLRHGGGGNTIMGLVGPACVYNEIKSAEWVEKQYLRGAGAIPFKTDRGAIQSTGDETSGQLSNTPFSIYDGTWRVIADTIDGRDVKVVEAQAAGSRCRIPTSCFKSTQTEAAFGTWDFWACRGAGGNTLKINFASTTEVHTGAGYEIEIRDDGSVEVNEIAITSHFRSAAGVTIVGQWDHFRITRRYDGQFVVYMNGVLLPANTGSNPFTDLTNTTASHFILDFDAGDKFAYSDGKGDHGLIKYLGVVAP